DIAVKHDLYIISDEIYDRLTYDGEHVSVPTLNGAFERTILLNGFSKAYAMTGWRIGYAAGPTEIIKNMMKVHQYTMLCAPRMAQAAALEAVVNGAKDRDDMTREYGRRRRVIVKGFREAGLDCFMPGGAFYVFCDLKQCVQKSEPSVWLNEKHPGMVRVELTHNLRNTREIAVSASGPVELPEEYCDTELKGPAPRVYISEPEEKFVKVAEILADYRNRGIDPDNTIILTMLGWKNYQKKDTIDIGDIKLRRVSGKDYCVSGNVLFTTARKFKGLEANHIIIIDLTERHLERDRELIYTAMSRSCMYLDVILSSKTKDPNFLRKAAAEWQLESVGL
ncbi:MAG: aminotransferase class I/II-fold pyridoxal phosphate-dependent enzyme, partial [Abditibacteriota bacterium]|nr:aminotransferase class I/II-fold pyridoxal phosphate-dependent enzyme [Abditibacteriota bacterium]